MTRLVFVALLLAACKKDDPGPPCGKVVDHMLEVMKQGLTGHDSLQLGNRKPMVELCEKRQFSKEARLCLASAKDLAGIASCQKLVAPNGPPPPPAAPAAGSAAPAGSGTPPP